MKILGNFLVKHSFQSPYCKCIYRPCWYAKDHSPQAIMFALDMQKKTCLRNFRYVQRCTGPIMCLILRRPNQLSPFSGSKKYVLLNEKQKIYKGPIRSAIQLNKLLRLIASIFVSTDFSLSYQRIVEDFLRQIISL